MGMTAESSQCPRLQRISFRKRTLLAFRLLSSFSCAGHLALSWTRPRRPRPQLVVLLAASFTWRHGQALVFAPAGGWLVFARISPVHVPSASALLAPSIPISPCHADRLSPIIPHLLFVIPILFSAPDR